MGKLLKRNQFLSQYQSEYIIEALANEVNWGDSLLGRMINSMIRKFEIMLDFRDVDKCIKRLQAEFDKLSDYVKVKKTEDIEVKLFYIQISLILGILQKKAEESTERDVMIKQTEDAIKEVTAISAPNTDCEKDKQEVLSKLEEFKKQLNESEVGKDDGEKDDAGKNPKPGAPGSPQLALNPAKPTLALTKGIEELPKALDVAKLTKDDAKLYLPKYITAIENSESILAKYKNELKSTVISTEVHNLNNDQTIELKKKYREATLLSHPDRNKDEDANVIFEKVKEAYEKKDLKTLSKILDYLNKIKSEKNKKSNLKKVKSELNDKIKSITAGERTDQKALTSGSEKEIKQLPGEKEKEKTEKEPTPQEVDVQESKLYSYLEFIKENDEIKLKLKDELDDDKEVKDDIKKSNFEDGEKIDENSKSIREIFESIFTVEFMKKYQFSDKDAQDFEETEETSVDIDPIIEIVKIFNRSYKITTPGTIPSGRKEGIVSQSLYKGYEYVGDGPNPGTLGEGGNVKPGIGPYRNRALFNKWENAVLDIIKNPKYQVVFNEKTYFKFGKADTRSNVNEERREGGGKSLLKFMNEMLDGGKLYKEGAQKKFIEEYFGVTIDEKKLNLTNRERKENQITANKQKDKALTVYKFETYNPSASSALKVDNTQKVIFRGVTKEKTRYYFRIIHVENNIIYFIMTGACPYDIKIDDVKEPLKKDGTLYVGTADWTDFQNKKTINQKRLISSKEKVSTWKDGNEFTAKIETLQILKDSEGETFRGDVKGKEKEHQEKISSINLNLKDVIQRLKS